LLLYAWGWSVVGMIAYWTGIAALLGAVAVLIALALGFAAHERQVKREERAGAFVNTAEAARQPVSVG
jgi:hypothetical protein